MRRQTVAVVNFRCGNCRQRYPMRTPPALGCVEQGPDGIWRPFRLKRVGQPLKPFTLDTSPMDDARWVFDPSGRTAKLYEPFSPTLTLPCRDCRRTPPPEVPWKEYAVLAVTQGLGEVVV
jgi:hypothetical protein